MTEFIRSGYLCFLLLLLILKCTTPKSFWNYFHVLWESTSVRIIEIQLVEIKNYFLMLYYFIWCISRYLPIFIVCKNCFWIFSELSKPFADKILIAVLASRTELLSKSDVEVLFTLRVLILLALLRALRALLVDAMFSAQKKNNRTSDHHNNGENHNANNRWWTN